MTKQDKVAAAIISFIGSIFPVLNLAGVTDLTADGISILMICVNQAVTLGGLLFQLQWDKE